MRIANMQILYLLILLLSLQLFIVRDMKMVDSTCGILCESSVEVNFSK